MKLDTYLIHDASHFKNKPHHGGQWSFPEFLQHTCTIHSMQCLSQEFIYVVIKFHIQVIYFFFLKGMKTFWCRKLFPWYKLTVLSPSATFHIFWLEFINLLRGPPGRGEGGGQKLSSAPRHPEAPSPPIGIPGAALHRPPSPGCQAMGSRLSCRCIVELGFNLRRVHTKNHFTFASPPCLSARMHFSFTRVVILCHHKLAWACCLPLFTFIQEFWLPYTIPL